MAATPVPDAWELNTGSCRVGQSDPPYFENLNKLGVNTISKTTEKLKAEKAENEQEIDQIKHRNQRLDNRIRYLTEGERKKRSHRLITRGAAVECLVPAVKDMGETDFFDLMEKVFSLPEVKPLLPSGKGGDQS